MARMLSTIAVLLAVSGCVGFNTEVRQRAAFDLECPEPRVAVTSISASGTAFGARGCGRHAAYLIRSGQVVLNSAIKDDRENNPLSNLDQISP